MLHYSFGTNLTAVVIPIYHRFCGRLFVAQGGFVHCLWSGKIICPSVCEGYYFFSGKLTTRKPRIPAYWCHSIAVFLRASPFVPISRLTSSERVQRSVLQHVLLGHGNDDASRLCSLHPCMHLSWSNNIFVSLKRFISRVGGKDDDDEAADDEDEETNTYERTKYQQQKKYEGRFKNGRWETI